MGLLNAVQQVKKHLFTDDFDTFVLGGVEFVGTDIIAGHQIVCFGRNGTADFGAFGFGLLAEFIASATMQGAGKY